RRPRGTLDVLPDDAVLWRRLEDLIAVHNRAFGYGEIRVPVFEETEVYLRTSGASSDIVRKEMYTFTDRGGRSLTLRPEGTAGVARAYLENGLPSAPQPVKLWYLGPMFRYDRPQAGRYRQHTQYGIEVFGAASPLADAEVIIVAHELFLRLGLTKLVVRLNSIGCPVCRPAYRERLTAFFRARSADLCEDCRERLSHNPLRIFDCKSEPCRAILDDAPLSADNLCRECSDHLARVKEGLGALGIAWVDDPRLVRGLDYYTRTVFEVVYTPAGERAAAERAAPDVPGDAGGAGGAQNVLCGGGRYDGLIEELGGKPTPGVGFGMGLERLLAVMEAEGLGIAPVRGRTDVAVSGRVPEDPEQGPAVFVATVGEPSEIEGLRLAMRLRRAGLRVLTDLLSRSLKAQLKAADRMGARWALILGEDELASGTVVLKDLAGGGQSTVARNEVVEVLAGG
ncbi:MAG: histidine--tRNA ligase, partial [Bacillota bacterium]